MIKAVAKKPDGTDLLVIGLSFGNLKKFKQEPGNTYIKIEGSQIGLPVDVLIFSGKTERDMMHDMRGMIGPDTKVNIDPRMSDA